MGVFADDLDLPPDGKGQGLNVRAFFGFVFVLAVVTVPSPPVTAAPAEPSSHAPLVEMSAPIVVEVAPLSIAEPSHGEPSTDVQEAMERHSEQMKARAAAIEASQIGLPPNRYGASYGGIAVTYNTGYPAPGSVRTVVDAAINQWDAVIDTNPSGPIVIEVFWSDLGNPSLLGYAGPDGMFYGGGLPDGSLYPAALANTLLGIDANGGARAEIQVVLNSQLLTTNRWYLGTTGTPPGNQIDLYSVVLHEVGHGLGFLGSATVPTGESSPSLHNPPYVYDTVASHNGTSVPDVSNQAAALLSGDVHVSVSTELSYELYAPASWSQGSSFSHFDEHTYPAGSPGALMTPMLGNGETARVLDSPVLGLMARTGWPTTVAATTPTITAVSPSLTSVVVSWDQNLAQVGLAPDGYAIEAWRDGSTLQSTTIVSGGASSAVVGSLSPGVSYTIKVIPTAGGDQGAPASATVQLSSSGGPAHPSEWPTYIRDLPLDGQINRLYQAYFLRLADEAGFGYWIDQRARWTSLSDISAAFAASGEFQSRYGSLSDAAFVDLVYANVLNRLADPGGRAYWLDQLAQGVPRGDVMIGFAESAEYVASTGTTPATGVTEAKITRLYRAFFLRPPDSAGLDYWSAQAAAGVALDAIAAAFAQSSEFQTRYGSLDHQQFVELVYGNVLGRAPDSGGLDYWTGLLQGGVDRGTVMVGFSESVEFIKSTGTIP